MAAIAAASLPAAQQQPLLDYMAFYSQRSQLTAELVNPSDPDAVAATGTKAF